MAKLVFDVGHHDSDYFNALYASTCPCGRDIEWATSSYGGMIRTAQCKQCKLTFRMFVKQVIVVVDKTEE